MPLHVTLVFGFGFINKWGRLVMELVEESAKGLGEHVVPGSFGNPSILQLRASPMVPK